ncbi:MAG: putative phosphoenolpyruvate synthase [Methanocella sp. PtaU1.Bin125]|nr:MAG: putative phosphoenolpyruvate synthase [Methanocella sp. PtaU1.Bin125]
MSESGVSARAAAAAGDSSGRFLRISQAATRDPASVGGKASNLIALSSAGFPVPDGIVVPVGEYERFLAANGLDEQVRGRLGRACFGDRESVASCAADIKAMIEQAPVDKADAAAIDAALAAVGGGLWAVRSSAVAEDLEDASFAGQQDTFLNVRPEEVPAYVRRCWASYWNDRAIAYRHAAGVPQLAGGIAVIVQRMADATVAGVTFTVDPVDASGERMVIEAAWGLGEAIVSGLVSPDRFTCDRRTLEITGRKPGSKARGIFASPGGRVEEIDAQRRAMLSLTDAQVVRLAQTGLAIERHFGTPQDIEWAIEDGEVRILQSRPITTLNGDGDSDTLWTRAYGDEYWADVTSPLFFSLLGEHLSKYVLDEGNAIMGYKELKGLDLLKLHKGHIYFNSAVLEAVFIYNPKFSRTKELLNYFPEKDQARIASARTKIFRRAWAEVRIAVLDPDGMMTKTDKAYRRWAEGFVAKMKRFDATDLRPMSDSQLYDAYRDLDAAVLKHYRLIRYGMVTHSIATNLILKNWLTAWLGDTSGAMYAKLISGLPGNRTIETNIAVAKLASAARADETTLKALQSMSAREFARWLATCPESCFTRQFKSFMDGYGHRSHTREIYYPRWSDDPALVVDILKALAASPVDLEALEQDRIRQRIAAEKEVLARVGQMRFGALRKLAFRPVMQMAQTYLMFRENQRFYLDHMLLRFRRIFLEYGRRLAERGVIESPEDVFFLSKEEVFAAAGGDVAAARKVAARKREFFRYADRLPPKFLKGSREFDDTLTQEAGSLKITGTAASPGIAKGSVRVVESIAGLSGLREGEILVTSNTDPGWTPVFSKIGGLVTETGGILSHGAVVSREYGIPAVTAVKNARRIFRDGQQVVVDGNDGIIYTESAVVDGNEGVIYAEEQNGH